MATSGLYKLIGTELSPFSVKVRAYFRFKGIPHHWVVGFPGLGEYKDRFRIAVAPLVVTPDDQTMQDSTPIIEELESKWVENSIYPEDPIVRFLSYLLEEFADEWGNKWMFHYRWARDVDAHSAACRAALLVDPEATEEEQAKFIAPWIDRMRGRVWFVGSNEQNAHQIESGFMDALALLDQHLRDRPYLLGARPSFGDFGLWAQVYNAWNDPTCHAHISNKYLYVQEWIQRMMWPNIQGDFESWETLENTLAPLISEHIGARFLPWSVANAHAILNGEEEFSVELPTGTWTQKPQKYHAKSLREIRSKYQLMATHQKLSQTLDSLGCLSSLSAD